MTAPEPYASAHCTHWSERGEWCCGCGESFSDVWSAWDDAPCFGPEHADARPSASPTSGAPAPGVGEQEQQ